MAKTKQKIYQGTLESSPLPMRVHKEIYKELNDLRNEDGKTWRKFGEHIFKEYIERRRAKK